MKTRKTTNQTINRAFMTAQLTTIARDNFKPAALLQPLLNIIARAYDIKKPAWETGAVKILDWLKAPIKDAIITPFKMFAIGNSKLPFLSWSTLPGFNCPGALECWLAAKGFCYSLKAWRYPAPLFRQLQNTLIERSPAYRGLIHAELKKLLNSRKFRGQNVPFRLYVDGDFSSLQGLRFWMDTLKKFPQLKAYGYSKSLHLFKELDESGYQWPTNYALNLSSGGMYQNGPVFDYVNKMHITRGEFIAVNTTKETLKAWKENALTPQQRRDIKQQVNSRKTFICPGKCGECTLIKENPHACGNLERFKDVKILIPIH